MRWRSYYTILTYRYNLSVDLLEDSVSGEQQHYSITHESCVPTTILVFVAHQASFITPTLQKGIIPFTDD